MNRFKTFKKLVESKILSKSERNLEMGKIGGGTGTNVTNGGPTVGHNVNGKPNQIVTATVLTARDNFMRRSSRTSFSELEVSLLSHLSWLTFQHYQRYTVLCIRTKSLYYSMMYYRKIGIELIVT